MQSVANRATLSLLTLLRPTHDGVNDSELLAGPSNLSAFLVKCLQQSLVYPRPSPTSFGINLQTDSIMYVNNCCSLSAGCLRSDNNVKLSQLNPSQWRTQTCSLFGTKYILCRLPFLFGLPLFFSSFPLC